LQQATTGNDAITNRNGCNQSSKPSLIMMDAADAIIVKHQSAHERSVHLTLWREPCWLALEPQGGLANKRDKGIGRTLWVSQQYSSGNKHQSPWRKRGECNQEPGSLLNGKPQEDWVYSCLRSPVIRTLISKQNTQQKTRGKTIKNTAMWHLRHVSCMQHLLDEQRRQSTDTVPSNNETSANCGDNNKDKNCHLHFDTKLKAGCVAVVPFASLTLTTKLSQQNKKKIYFLHSWTAISNFTDTILIRLDSIYADLNRSDDVTNLFNFDKWRSTASRTSESTLCTKYLEIVQYKSGLQNSNKLSSLKTADIYGTISMVDSTGNAPKSTSTQPVRYIFADDVYTNLEQISAKVVMDINSNNNIPKQLTPVTIMVVDTISSVKSRILLKVLLDSGSTTTMINRECLPRKFQTCKIANSRKIGTLAGFYMSLEMVVLCNLRLPELDKNHNVDQQQALVFDADSCRYDVILGSDFLSKTWIDVKYSTGTIEWFDN
jgi:hypothetical protein